MYVVCVNILVCEDQHRISHTLSDEKTRFLPSLLRALGTPFPLYRSQCHSHPLMHPSPPHPLMHPSPPLTLPLALQRVSCAVSLMRWSGAATSRRGTPHKTDRYLLSRGSVDCSPSSPLSSPHSYSPHTFTLTQSQNRFTSSSGGGGGVIGADSEETSAESNAEEASAEETSAAAFKQLTLFGSLADQFVGEVTGYYKLSASSVLAQY